MASYNPLNKILKSLSSVKTGIILLILVVIASAVGTFVLQRPTTEADQIERAYSPQTLHVLDKLGLTDVFHAWWFAFLLALVAISIILVSIDRFPRAWKVLTKPYKITESHFRAVLPAQERIPVADGHAALDIAEQAFRKAGLKPERVGPGAETSLYAERNRFSVLAVYVIHASLLLIFIGGMIDAIAGYKGFLMLNKGQSTTVIELSDKTVKQLPFTIRFDNGGRENYQDGSPKKWWSDLTVLENGKVIQKKQIVVNDPLVYRGVRFYQSSFGTSSDLAYLSLLVSSKSDSKDTREITVNGDSSAQIDPDTTVRIGRFIPDYVIRDGEIYAKSNDPVNPAIQLVVESKKAGTSEVWIFPKGEDTPPASNAPYEFTVKGGELASFTGLSVSHEPGQWAVWAGCLLMAVGLGMAFYCVHRRYWAVVVEDAKVGQVLWLGTQADKNREHYQEEFREITNLIRGELQLRSVASATPEERESLAAVQA